MRCGFAIGVMLLLFGGCSGGISRCGQCPAAPTPTPTGDKREGFRYYLPKPYLLVTSMTVLPTPGLSTTPKPGSKATPPSGETSDQQEPKEQEKSKAPEQPVKENSIITAQLIWLPDLKRQYAISVRGGRTRSFKGAPQLANGWMLEPHLMPTRASHATVYENDGARRE